MQYDWESWRVEWEDQVLPEGPILRLGLQKGESSEYRPVAECTTQRGVPGTGKPAGCNLSATKDFTFINRYYDYSLVDDVPVLQGLISAVDRYFNPKDWYLL